MLAAFLHAARTVRVIMTLLDIGKMAWQIKSLINHWWIT